MYAVYSVLLVFTSPETLEGMYIFSDNPPVQRREVIEYPQYLGVILSVLFNGQPNAFSYSVRPNRALVDVVQKNTQHVLVLIEHRDLLPKLKFLVKIQGVIIYSPSRLMLHFQKAEKVSTQGVMST